MNYKERLEMSPEGENITTSSNENALVISRGSSSSSCPQHLQEFTYPLYSVSYDLTMEEYMAMRNYCLEDRQRLGIGCSNPMSSLFRFWSYFLMKQFNYEIYTEFKALANEDAENGFYYGLACLFRFYSYDLRNVFKPDIYEDFVEAVIKDYQNGNLYGLEKYWTFFASYEHNGILNVHPLLVQYLSNFKSIQDFRRLQVGPRTDKMMKSHYHDQLQWNQNNHYGSVLANQTYNTNIPMSHFHTNNMHGNNQRPMLFTAQTDVNKMANSHCDQLQWNQNNQNGIVFANQTYSTNIPMSHFHANNMYGNSQRPKVFTAQTDINKMANSHYGDQLQWNQNNHYDGVLANQTYNTNIPISHFHANNMYGNNQRPKLFTAQTDINKMANSHYCGQLQWNQNNHNCIVLKNQTVNTYNILMSCSHTTNVYGAKEM